MAKTKRFAPLIGCIAALGAAMWVSAPAVADLPVLSFSYGGLSASYWPGEGSDTGVFEAVQTMNRDGDPDTLGDYTSGSVRRLVPPSGTAEFSWNPAFQGTPFDVGSATVLLHLVLTDIDRVQNTASATGTLTAADIHGDYIEGVVSGTWTLDPGNIAHFDGTMSGLIFEPPDGEFNGNIAGSFSMDFTQFDQMIGSIVDLTGVGGNFFADEFIGLESEVISQIIPAPSAVLLGAIGLGLIGRIRRWI